VKLVHLVGFIIMKCERSSKYFNYNSEDAEEDDDKHSPYWEKCK